MPSRRFKPCYSKAAIPALALLVAFSGTFALSEPDKSVQGGQEAGKNSDPAPQAPPETTASVDKSADKPGTGKDEDRRDEEQVSSAKPAQTATAPADTAPKPPVWHRLQMRLSGSMCFACLKDLQDNLLKYAAIERVKIDKPAVNYFQAVSPEVSSWANGIVIYDEQRISLDQVRIAIKQQGYHSYRIVDKALDHKPEDKDMKF